MTKSIFFAALVLAVASTAQAQNTSNSSDATAVAAATIGGIFTPNIPVGANVTYTTATVNATASTTIPAPAANTPAANVFALAAGNTGARATFIAGLRAASIPEAAATALANAVAQLNSSSGAITGANLSTAMASWNAAIATLTTPQLLALAASEQGQAALSMLTQAYATAK